MALAAQHRRPMLLPHGAAGSFALLGLMILGGYFGISALYQRVNPSPERMLGSLSSSAFAQPLPGVLSNMWIDIRANEEESYVSINLNTPVEPEGFRGDEARISYLVFDSAADATREFEKVFPDPGWQAQRQEAVAADTFEFETLPISERNYCVGFRDRLHYCQVLVGPVWIDVTSHLEMARISDDPYLPELTAAALDHLRSAVPGID